MPRQSSGILYAVLTAVGLLLTLVVGAGCTVSPQAECRADSDCAGGERCFLSGGVFVQDGVCVPLEFETDLDAGHDVGDEEVGIDDVGDDVDAGSDADVGDVGDVGELECGQNEEVCGAVCVDLSSHDQHCGGCNSPCGGPRVCEGGNCLCEPGLTECGGQCVDSDFDPQHCGGCDIECSGIEFCLDGVCEADCPPGLEACDGACFNLDIAIDHCGGCGQECSADVNGATASCVEGGCVIEYICDPGGAPFGGGDGSDVDPWLICTADHLNAVAGAPGGLGSSYLLFDDIDMSVLSGDFNVIGTLSQPFNGYFDGDGYEIENLTIDRSNQGHVGLFGYVGGGGQVVNIRIVNADVVGDYGVGVLVGENHGIISRVLTTGSVTGDEFVGGLVGNNWGDISESYSLAEVNGDFRVGGLVGRHRGGMEDCYAAGPVTGSSSAGGLIGTGPGNFGQVQRSYWDILTTTQNNSAAGTGLETDDFGDASTFAGWDFNDVWEIGVADDGEERPLFQGQ